MPTPDVYWNLLKSEIISYAGAEPNKNLIPRTPYIQPSSSTEEEERLSLTELDQSEPEDVEPEDEQPEDEPTNLQYFVDDKNFPAQEAIIEGKKVYIWKGPKNTADIVLATKLGPVLTADEIRNIKAEIGAQHRHGIGDTLKPKKERHRFDEKEIQEDRPPRHVLPDLMLPHSCWVPGGFRRTIRNNFRRAAGGRAAGLEPGVAYTDGHEQCNNVAAWKKVINRKLAHPLPLFLLDFSPDRCYCKM